MTAQEMLDLYIAAEAAVLSGKEYQDHKGRVFKRENLAEIRAGRKEWELKVVNQAKAAKGRGGIAVSIASFNP